MDQRRKHVLEDVDFLDEEIVASLYEHPQSVLAEQNRENHEIGLTQMVRLKGDGAVGIFTPQALDGFESYDPGIEGVALSKAVNEIFQRTDVVVVVGDEVKHR